MNGENLERRWCEWEGKRNSIRIYTSISYHCPHWLHPEITRYEPYVRGT
jgi:hypothetical protein